MVGCWVPILPRASAGQPSVWSRVPAAGVSSKAVIEGQGRGAWGVGREGTWGSASLGPPGSHLAAGAVSGSADWLLMTKLRCLRCDWWSLGSLEMDRSRWGLQRDAGPPAVSWRPPPTPPPPPVKAGLEARSRSVTWKEQLHVPDLGVGAAGRGSFGVAPGRALVHPAVPGAGVACPGMPRGPLHPQAGTH